MARRLFNLKDGATISDTPAEKIQETSKIVESILKDHFPDYITFDESTFAIQRGSSSVMIIVRPFVNQETAIEFLAHVVTEADITEELMSWLLRKNAELHFGTFGLIFDNTITFSHTLPGSNLSANEFVTVLDTVSYLADTYDDEIVSLSGGKRAIDSFDLLID